MPNGTFTMDDMRAAMARVREIERANPVPAASRIVFTANALAETEERNFPASRNRSKRIYKKLVKRFGGEFRKEPAMWRVGGVIYAHPALKGRINSALDLAGVTTAPDDEPEEKKLTRFKGPFYGGPFGFTGS